MFRVGQIAVVAFVATLVLASSGNPIGKTPRGSQLKPSFVKTVLQEVDLVTSGSASHGVSSYGSAITKPISAITSGAGSWDSDGTKPFPHLIWVDLLKKKVVPARVSIRTAQENEEWKLYGPTTWEFVGSNDEPCNEKSRWTVLCGEWDGAPFKRKTQNKYCDVDKAIITTPFKCLGISILDAPDEQSTTVKISNIRIWAYWM